MWRDVMGEGGGERQKAPYLTHKLKGEVKGVEFCPFEDSLGIGHGNGFTSIIVPGESRVLPVSVCSKGGGGGGVFGGATIHINSTYSKCYQPHQSI